jgi:hypothetical protein
MSDGLMFYLIILGSVVGIVFVFWVMSEVFEWGWAKKVYDWVWDFPSSISF